MMQSTAVKPYHLITYPIFVILPALPAMWSIQVVFHTFLGASPVVANRIMFDFAIQISDTRCSPLMSISSIHG